MSVPRPMLSDAAMALAAAAGVPASLLPAASKDQPRLPNEQDQIQRELDDVLLTAIRITNASFNNMRGTQVSLGGGSSPDARTSDGNAAIHWAGWNDLPHVMSLLLTRGANPHVANQQGVTPLMWSAIAGSVPCLRLLLQVCSID